MKKIQNNKVRFWDDVGDRDGADLYKKQVFTLSRNTSCISLQE